MYKENSLIIRRINIKKKVLKRKKRRRKAQISIAYIKFLNYFKLSSLNQILIKYFLFNFKDLNLSELRLLSAII